MGTGAPSFIPECLPGGLKPLLPVPRTPILLDHSSSYPWFHQDPLAAILLPDWEGKGLAGTQVREQHGCLHPWFSITSLHLLTGR